MIELSDNSFCTGCSSCVNACPQNCITMQWDKAFLYPSIDKEKCVNCGVCDKICPVLNQKESGLKICNVYAFQNKDKESRTKSTSGGFFLSVAKKIVEQNGVVYAAGFDQNMKVVHKKASQIEELNGLQGSKYVQSYLGKIFTEIKELLEGGTKVLFVGTPCQVEGILSYIEPNYQELLYTIDFTCYGVPSPKLYSEWISLLESKYKKKIKHINFRDKKYGYAGVNIRIDFEDGKKLEDRFDAKSFLKTMFSNICLRESCYNCFVRGKNKKNDITMGDMWDIGNYNNNLDDDLGTTKIMIHTEKGLELFNQIEGTKEYIKTYDDKELEQLRKSETYIVKQNERHNDFVRDTDIMSYEELIKKYLPPSNKDRVANITKPIINKLPFAKMFFKNLKKKKMENIKK